MMTPIAPSVSDRVERLGSAAILLIAIVLYFWSSLLGTGPGITKSPNGYYNLQAEGFRTGHLYAAVEPDPALLNLEDPYDPVANAPYRMHDMTYWRGHYYLYFGVAPVLLIFLPFRLLAGAYISEAVVVAGFVSLGMVLSTLLLQRLRRRWFPTTPTILFWSANAVVALGSPVIYLVQSPQFYQVPISCAYALLMAGVFCLGEFVSRDRSRALRWLVAGGTCFGLCLAARPNYILAMPCLGIPVAWWIMTGGRNPREWREWIRPGLAAFLPVLAVGILVMLYNWLRFGNPAEFGMRYQLAGQSFVSFKPLALEYLGPHLREYLWMKVWWLPYFPFVESSVNGPFGILRYLPFAWLGAAAFWPGRFLGEGEGSKRRALGWLLLGCGLANLLMDSLFFFLPELRYVSDFGPVLLLAAAVGAFRVAEARPRLGSIVATALAVFNLAMVGGIFIERLPSDYRSPALARAGNRVASWIDGLVGRRYGGIRLTVELPAKPTAPSEPMIQTGNSVDRRDWLEIHYLDGGWAQLGYFHAGLGEIRGEPVPVPASRRLTIEAFNSAFLPPGSHPFFAGWSEDEIERAEQTVFVRVNGVPVLRLALPAYPSTPSDMILGKRGFGPEIEGAFSGKIIGVESIPALRPALPKIRRGRLEGPLVLTLQLPALSGGFEPIVANGLGENSQLLYAIYGPDHHVQLALDTPGEPPLKSRIVTFDPTTPAVITVWLGSWAQSGPASHRFFVKYNDVVLFDEDHRFHRPPDAPTVVGKNSVGSGAASARFTGLILDVQETPAQLRTSIASEVNAKP